MMASMASGFHPNMQQHPGVHPGHPMSAPGMAHNPSQPGAQPGMPPQMGTHMAMSGPGGQVNPAAMMGGMPPGAGPTPHALQHLNPQMFQNPQQFALAQNPQLMTQIQQQQLIQQQRQRQMMQQQMYGGGMPMNVPGMNMAQFQAMRNGNMQRVGMPPQQALQQAHLAQQGQHQNPQHAQQLLAQQIAMQQQQQHQAQQQANHMHQGNQPGHPPQMTPQQIQNIQQAQLAQSMGQQVPQGSQGQGPQPQPQPQGQPQQPGQQPQPQPQQPGPQPGQQPQPNSQGPQRAPTPAVAQQNQAQNPTPNSAQGNQPQQPQGQGQPPNGQQAQPQQPNPQMMQAAQHAQHPQMPMSNSIQQQLMHQHKNDGMKGQCLLKLLQFGEHLSGYQGAKSKDDLSYWNSFVSQFFSPRGVFRVGLYYICTDPTNEDHTDKQYEITQPALARYFHTHFASGIRRINLTFERGISDRPLPNGCHFIEYQKASMTWWFDNSHVVATGTLRAQFDNEQKLDFLEFVTQGHEEYHSRKMIIEAAKPAHVWGKEWLRVNGQDSRPSPEMSKKGKTKQMKSPPNPPPDIDLPQSAVKQNIGITEAVFQFLEIIEVVGQMNPLFNFYHTHNGLSPYGALEQYVNQYIINPQPPVMNGQVNGPPNPRTPSFGQFPMGASPAATHLQLPNSPHIGSPAQGHMQAPGMQLQQSQQGTSSGGPSANTSPASNKRRRASTVKAEEDSGAPTPASIGAPQVNGVVAANKKPPTPRMQKRAKVNPPG
ncbi:LIM-domain binding protein-domain-containing protein [Hypoxylon sp. FL1284]|nr:LIM-domain binding protein-domain-containing protein [Hypoxylon sp. FL1284]